MLVYQRVIVDISSVLDYIFQRRELAQFVLNDDATKICSSTFALQILDTNNKEKVVRMVYLHVQEVVTILNKPSSSFLQISQ